jgi:glycosyltransferase involved in cell wall biosynthesis
VSTKTGGTPQTNQDLMLALDLTLEKFVLFSNSKKIDLYMFENVNYFLVESRIIDKNIEVLPHQSEEYDATVAEWLVNHAFELIHIRHLAWHSLGLIDIGKSLGIPIVFSLHDFYTVCPTVKLLDANQKYCGGVCTAGTEDCKYDLWTGNLPPLKNAAINQWRIMFESVFEKCDHFVTTNQSAREIITTSYPGLIHKPFSVLPHGRDFPEFLTNALEVEVKTAIKLLIPGNITKAKGGAIIASLAAKARSLNIEIHILGKIASNINTQGCVLHGEYSRDDFCNKVKEVSPHIGCIFSIWPETHCHTLTELWAAGLPVIGFSIGAVGDRIKKTGAGWAIEDFTAEAVEGLLMELRTNQSKYIFARKSVATWQQSDALKESCQAMALQYLNIYSQLVSFS